MDEKPKSIWKKSWAGWRSLLLAWLGLMIVTLIIFWIIMFAVGARITSDELKLWAALALCATVVIFTVLFFRWLFCWSNFKRFLFGFACFATLIALFYAEEDWRGKHDWEKFKHQWEAKGERFDWQSIVPPPVPDDQNFAFSPVWIAEEKYNFLNQPKRAEAWYGDRIYIGEVVKNFLLFPVTTTAVVGTNFWKSNDLHPTPEQSGSWQTARFLDLKPWQSFYRDLEKTNPTVEISIMPQPQTPAQDVLLALSKFDPVIEKLKTDSALPYSRFPLNYESQPPSAILLPHLAALKQCSQVLHLRAIAELQNNESQKALDDVKLSLRLTDSIRTEPFLICHLVRIAIFQITLQPIYEGLAEHKWSDAQLADLDSELAKLDFLADNQFAVRGERALEIANIEFLRHPPQNPQFKRPRLYFLAPFFSLVQMLYNLSSNEGENPEGLQMLVLGFGPSGWLHQNELRLAQFETKWYLPIVNQETKTISPAKTRAASDALSQEIQHRTPENILETVLMPALGGGERKFAYVQSSANLARVAIALERYRLAHGEFPESLDALAPQFMEKIPHDVIGGEPLKYRRTDDGQFVLYSVGWNETDDGGVVGLTKSGGVNNEKGDWVWRYPSKQ
jgi:hypothetical protein